MPVNPFKGRGGYGMASGSKATWATALGVWVLVLWTIIRDTW